MRIAVSGTHCSGKSTLVEGFLRAHPDFVHEPEPYRVMVEDYGEEFSAEPSADDFFRQLEFQVARLRTHLCGERVIYDRSPLDFLAYLRALRDLQSDRDSSDLAETARRIALKAVEDLDLIVFLPLDEASGIEVPDAEYPRLRDLVDSHLNAIFAEGELERPGQPQLLEATGSSADRLRMIEQAMRAAGQQGSTIVG